MTTPKSISIAVVAAIAFGCSQDPVVSTAKKEHAEVIGTEPKKADVVGTYVLSDQTIVPGGMSALGGRQCQLDVLADGSFSVTNYPQSAGGSFISFLSGTGSWEIATVGTSYGYGPDPKDCWGFRFRGSDVRIDPTAFTGPEAPYGLLTILGDPDTNQKMRFKKK
jgi:hypothetical protein